MFKDFKPILGILLRFVVIYLVLLLSYQFYLNFFESSGLDPYSRLVAQNAVWFQNLIGYRSFLFDDVPNHQMWFYVNGKYVTRMVEGCNAISVIILFLAFIFAFYKGFKTFVFAFIGLMILYVLNILRIVGLNIVCRDYQQYQKMFHDYIFPSVIYGGVVLLWLIWIKFYALKNEKS